MSVMVFDTETTSLDKPFCYNIGYVVVDDEGEILKVADFVIEQIWHNLPLFQSAYYADKRPLYVKAMKCRKTKMDKFGYICQQMIRDIKNFEINSAYAYNSPFDERVFDFNCDWFKCSNPFDLIPVFDIRGYAHQFICKNAEYKQFCEDNELFTESGNYSTTAEAVFKYISQKTDFEEEHTALSDSLIENEILKEALASGAELETSYPTIFSLAREVQKELAIVENKEVLAVYPYKKITINKERTKITLKN